MEKDRALRGFAGWRPVPGTSSVARRGTAEAAPGGTAGGAPPCAELRGVVPGPGGGNAAPVPEEAATGTRQVAAGRGETPAMAAAGPATASTDATAQAADRGTDFLRSPAVPAAPGIAVASSLPRGSGYPYQGSACGVGSKFPGAVGGLAELVARDLLGNVALHVWWVLRSAEQASPGLPGGVSSLAGATPAVSFCFQNAVRSAPRTLI